MILIQITKHETQVINSQWTDALKLVTDGRDAGNTAAWLAWVVGWDGGKRLYKDLDATGFTRTRGTCQNDGCKEMREEWIMNLWTDKLQNVVALSPREMWNSGLIWRYEVPQQMYQYQFSKKKKKWWPIHWQTHHDANLCGDIDLA